MSELPRPTPRKHTAAFWEKCNEEILPVHSCQNCGHQIFYPQAICPSCFGENWEVLESTGKGTILTYTIIHRPATDAFADRIPLVYALIELDERVTLTATIRDCDPQDVTIGEPVTVGWEDRAGQNLYVFELAS